MEHYLSYNKLSGKWLLEVVFKLFKKENIDFKDYECLHPKLECEKGMEIPMFDQQTTRHPFLEEIGILKEQKFTCRNCKHVQSDWFSLPHLILKKKKTLHESLKDFFKLKKTT